jgi:hypothetical protein
MVQGARVTTTIRIPKAVTAERAIQLSAEVVDGTRPLHVPSRINYKSALSVSLVTQAIITWGARPVDGRLITDLDVEDARAGQTLTRNTPLLTGIAMATVIESTDGTDITDRARALAASVLSAESQDIPQLATGTTVGTDRAVIAVDHDPALQRPRGIYPRGPLDEEARPFYSGQLWTDVSRLRGRPPLGHRVLGISGHNPEGWGENYSATGSALGMLLFELLQNTDVHARTNVFGKPLPRSVRALHARGIAEKRDVLTRSDPGNRALMEFIANVPTASTNERIRLLVVSVMDSGPGLAATLLRRENYLAPRSPAHEWEYFLRALRMTSSGSTREPLRGLGLRRVQTFLTALGGYARIRSGRFEVERDFAKHPYTGPEESPRVWWGGVKAPTAKEQLAGTAFTLVIPVPPEADADAIWEAAANGG